MDGNGRFRIAVALLVVAGAACGSSSAERTSDTTVARSSSTAPDPTTTATPTTATPTTEARGCTHAPVLHRALQYYGTPAHGTSIDVVDAQLQQPVHDGRGDSFMDVGLGVDEQRPDGTVQLVDPEQNTSVVYRGFGDFDGDGRTDLLVDLYNATGNDSSSWIVPGTLAPGGHDPTKVGIRVPQGAFFAAVGDQNHDGADDVRVGPALYSGRQLTAPGAGQSLPAPFRVLDAIPVGLLAIDAHSAPTFVVPDTATGSLRVLDARADRLLLDIAPNDIPSGMTLANGQAGGWSVDGHTVVSFNISSRSGTSEWRWNLDDPCGQ